MNHHSSIRHDAQVETRSCFPVSSPHFLQNLRREMYVKEVFAVNSSASSPGSCNRTRTSSASVDARGDRSDAASQTKPTPFRSRKNLMRYFGTPSPTAEAEDRPDSGVSSDEEGEHSKWHAELFG